MSLLSLGLVEMSTLSFILSGCVPGPCGGKTTGQARLRTFFESIGWKVCINRTLVLLTVFKQTPHAL